MANITIQFDPLGALYLQFREAPVHKTVEFAKDAVVIDLDNNNNVLGIEILQQGELEITINKIRKKYRLPKIASDINYNRLEEAFVDVK